MINQSKKLSNIHIIVSEIEISTQISEWVCKVVHFNTNNKIQYTHMSEALDWHARKMTKMSTKLFVYNYACSAIKTIIIKFIFVF